VDSSCSLAESNEGVTVETIKKWAKDYDLAVCGSFLACENDKLYNRGFFAIPDGNILFYDKRHLFRMGDEDKNFTAGEKQLIVSYKGWNICLIVCYDLRFPVWSRNVENAYDLLICCANWPVVRETAWNILLKARAVENCSYVCGVNRIGQGEFGILYQGDSQLIDHKGNIVVFCEPNEEMVVTEVLSKDALEYFRKKFPVWMDADKFDIL